MNQYREGKVKSTPTRGVKQILKPDAYKQSEPERVTAYLLYNGSATLSLEQLKPIGVGAAKASLNRATSSRDKTRNRVI